jgi:hypothetical protein
VDLEPKVVQSGGHEQSYAKAGYEGNGYRRKIANKQIPDRRNQIAEGVIVVEPEKETLLRRDVEDRGR